MTRTRPASPLQPRASPTSRGLSAAHHAATQPPAPVAATMLKHRSPIGHRGKRRRHASAAGLDARPRSAAGPSPIAINGPSSPAHSTKAAPSPQRPSSSPSTFLHPPSPAPSSPRSSPSPPRSPDGLSPPASPPSTSTSTGTSTSTATSLAAPPHPHPQLKLSPSAASIRIRATGCGHALRGLAASASQAIVAGQTAAPLACRECRELAEAQRAFDDALARLRSVVSLYGLAHRRTLGCCGEVWRANVRRANAVWGVGYRDYGDDADEHGGSGGGVGYGGAGRVVVVRFADGTAERGGRHKDCFNRAMPERYAPGRWAPQGRKQEWLDTSGCNVTDEEFYTGISQWRRGKRVVRGLRRLVGSRGSGKMRARLSRQMRTTAREAGERIEGDGEEEEESM